MWCHKFWQIIPNAVILRVMKILMSSAMALHHYKFHRHKMSYQSYSFSLTYFLSEYNKFGSNDMGDLNER